MTSKLVPWPKLHMNISNYDYQRARADAAMERLRVAVEYMRAYQRITGGDLACSEALALIGEVPSE